MMITMSDDIGFSPATGDLDLPEVEDVDTAKMERQADKAVKYGSILEEKKDEKAIENGEPVRGNECPPDLVIKVSATISDVIQCEKFMYDDNEAEITAKTISIWFPMFSEKWYYTVLSILILISKVMTCARSMAKFAKGAAGGFKLRNRNVEDKPSEAER